MAAWEGKRTILIGAIDTLDANAVTSAAALVDAKREHEAAWGQFVNAARDALMDEFELRFAAFYAEVLGTVDALHSARRIYSGEPVYSGPRRSLGDSSIMVVSPGPAHNPSALGWKRLYPSHDQADLAGRLAAFRAMLADAISVPRRAKAAGSAR